MKPAPTPPPCWSLEIDGAGTTQLSFAVRGGAKQTVLLVLGAALLLGGLYGIYALVAGGDLTVAGFILLLVPAGIALAGVYVLDIALVVRTTYRLGPVVLTFARESLFGRRCEDIPRAAVQSIQQNYSPPGDSAPAGDPGDWTTLITYRALADGKERVLALAGLSTPAEARWLGPLLAEWAGLPLQRGFGPAFEEADPAELPDPS